jgi:hypothetical protein
MPSGKPRGLEMNWYMSDLVYADDGILGENVDTSQ